MRHLRRAVEATGTEDVQTRTLVRDTVERLVIQPDQVQVIVKLAPTALVAGSDDEEEAPRVLTMPLPISQPCVRKEIIIPGGRDTLPRAHDVVFFGGAERRMAENVGNSSDIRRIVGRPKAAYGVTEAMRVDGESKSSLGAPADGGMS